MNTATDGADDESPDACPEIQVAHQARFTTGGDVTTESDVTVTSLADFGVDVDDREGERRLDRPELDRRDEGEQAPLFADVDRDQRTLTVAQPAAAVSLASLQPPSNPASNRLPPDRCIPFEVDLPLWVRRGCLTEVFLRATRTLNCDPGRSGR